jgi:hypothetical protein
MARRLEVGDVTGTDIEPLYEQPATIDRRAPLPDLVAAAVVLAVILFAPAAIPIGGAILGLWSSTTAWWATNLTLAAWWLLLAVVLVWSTRWDR